MWKTWTYNQHALFNFSVLPCWIPAHDAKNSVTCQQASHLFLWEKIPCIATWRLYNGFINLQNTIHCWGSKNMVDEAGSMPWLGPSKFCLRYHDRQSRFQWFWFLCDRTWHVEKQMHMSRKSSIQSMVLLNMPLVICTWTTSSHCCTGCCKGHAGFDTLGPSEDGGDVRDERGAYHLCPAYL